MRNRALEADAPTHHAAPAGPLTPRQRAQKARYVSQQALHFGRLGCFCPKMCITHFIVDTLPKGKAPLWPLDFQIQKRIVSAETIWGNMVCWKFQLSISCGSQKMRQNRTNSFKMNLETCLVTDNDDFDDKTSNITLFINTNVYKNVKVGD